MIRLAWTPWMIAAPLALVAALAPPQPALAQDGPTPLDQALAAAKQDPDNGEAYFQLLAETPLFLAIDKNSNLDPESGAVSPTLIVSEHEGVALISAFDTAERLDAYATSHEFPEWTAVQLPPGGVFDLRQDDYILLINPETPGEFVLTPDLLHRLRGDPGVAAVMAVTKSDLAGLTPVELAPAALADAFDAAMHAQPSVIQAYVVNHPAAPPQASEGAYLAVIHVDARYANPPQIANALSVALAEALGEHRTMDFVFVNTEYELRGIVSGETAATYHR